MKQMSHGMTVLFATLVAAIPAFAAEEAGHGGGGGMPQLDPTSFASQIFWLVVTFLLLFWLLRTKALPRVSEILEARQTRVAADLDRAGKLREEAEAALVRYQQVVADAQAKAGTQIRETRERLVSESASRQAELDAMLAGKVADAEARVRASREAALADLNAVAVEVAQAAASRLIGRDVSREAAEAALAAVTREAA
jgi:F-type H+-transporting ATPase subunit b